MEKKVLYFGYGANRDLRMMAAITGNANLVGKSGILKGFRLCVQRLDQIPDTILSTAPAPISPRQTILDAGWDNSFKSYTMKPGSESDIVSGTIWELTPLERELVRNWELIDFGWYQDRTDIMAKTLDYQNIKVETEILGDGQEIDREVDGRNYNTWLLSPEDFKRNATKVREEYFARMQNPEGALKTPEY